MYQYGQYNRQAGWNPLQQQQPRLPPGWEAKWDPGSGRWFYINHATKTTQWEPPAPNAAQYQPPSSTTPRMNTTSFIDDSADNVKTLMSEYDGVSEEYIKSLLRIFQNNMAGVRRTLDEKGYKKKSSTTSSGIVPKQHFVVSLKNQYPTASEDIIKEVLVSTNNSFQGARTSLEAMGYKKKPQSPAKKTTTAKPNPKPASRPTTAKAGPSAAKPAKLTEQMKKQRYEELKKQFPKLDKSLIELSLEGTNYDVKVASAVLKSSLESVKSNKSSEGTSSSTTTKYSSSTTDTTYTTSPASLEPVIFGAEEEDKNKDKEKETSPVKISKPSATTSSTSTASRTETTYEHKRDYLPAKRVPIIRKTQPTGGYKSPNRITPAGPDSTLVSGPNYSLLQTTRIRAFGPNASNRSGPQVSNRCGPQASNAMGRGNINVGPAHRAHQTAV